MMRPQQDEFAPYYDKYISLIGEDVLAVLAAQQQSFTDYIRRIPEAQADYAYAEGKWTVKQALGHIIDTERIMAYRALRVGRGDTTPLPGFEQDEYVALADLSQRSLASYADEFAAVRAANLFLFRSFDAATLTRRGTASEQPVSVRALLYIVAGHLEHHIRIFDERYFQ
ncbi:DinB family protein [Taibaiella chishuiensis]|uniref:DinB family protein n=2 Tax=Taibaiella chishuiensis TaxID=1434707 RepID=A0A2P8DCT9_9BACT|nr:DinB family protein [Taibaiella chishuiensis]